MEEYPDRAVSWFGVACYYLCIGRYESARNYFGKATTVDASFAPAWLGFGHAFAAQDESDQASTLPCCLSNLSTKPLFRLGLAALHDNGLLGWTREQVVLF